MRCKLLSRKKRRAYGKGENGHTDASSDKIREWVNARPLNQQNVNLFLVAEQLVNTVTRNSVGAIKTRCDVVAGVGGSALCRRQLAWPSALHYLYPLSRFRSLSIPFPFTETLKKNGWRLGGNGKHPERRGEIVSWQRRANARSLN